MKKAMVSLPTAGKTGEEIVATRKKAIIALKDKGYEVIDMLYADDYEQNKEIPNNTYRGATNADGSLRRGL